MSRLSRILWLCGALSPAFGCGKNPEVVTSKTEKTEPKKPGLDSNVSAPQKDIVSVASEDARFSTLVLALKSADLLETVRGKGPFTVFAPTNEAFAKLGDETIKKLLGDKERLTNILLYHVVSGAAVDSKQAAAFTEAKMTNGAVVKISSVGGLLRINDATVTFKDISTSNGIIHVIDTVLLPPSNTAKDLSQPATLKDIVTIASEDSRFSTLVSAVKSADLVTTLQGGGPFTVFAPTNDAFVKLGASTINALLVNKEKLKNIILYHAVAGSAVTAEAASVLKEAKMANGAFTSVSMRNGSLFINDSQIIIKDIKASNGIIHVIDAVLMPTEKPMNVLEIAKADGRFKTLVAALQAADLETVLQGPGPFTVFAPTDDAFAKLGAAKINSLLADKNKLQYLLQNHAISGSAVSSESVSKLSQVTMVNGAVVSIKAVDNSLQINNANVIIKDIKATNGVIHVIDSVLLPPNDIASIVASDPRFKTLKGAIDATGLTSLLQGKTQLTVFAPTEDAFNKLGANKIQAGLRNPEKLKQIILYHILVGYSADASLVLDLGSLTMANLKIAKVTQPNGSLKINNANIIVRDIRADNGVIHVIDTVLVP